MRYNSRAIYGCTMAEPDLLPACPDDCRFTQSEDGKRLYIHILSYPFENLTMKNIGGKIEYAQFLHDASEIRYTEGKPAWTAGDRPDIMESVTFFRLPVVKPDVLVPVIEVFLK